MADLLIRQQGGKRFSWGFYQSLLLTKSDLDLYYATPVRKQYIQALQAVDQGDFSKLLAFARS